METYNGLIAVWKEPGYTSHDVVARMRGILHQKKIGHAGTLDPQAQGVLVVGLGLGTKTFELLPDHRKSYEAQITFGVETDTEDIWGQVLSRPPVSVTDPAQIRDAIESFAGTYEQVPPMYSAKRSGGKRLYELARKGVTVERRPVPVTIYDIRVQEVCADRAVFSVECSAGTYIRSLCRDIGERLGTKACMSRLTRTAACGFTADQAITLERLEELVREGREREAIVPAEWALACYPALTVGAAFGSLLKNGSAFSADLLPEGEERPPGGRYRVYLEETGFIGIFSNEAEEDRFTPVRIFYRKDAGTAR